MSSHFVITISVLCLALTTQVARGQDDAAAKPTAGRHALGVQLRGGGARAPFFTRAFPSTLGHGFDLRLRGEVRLDDRWSLRAQLPLALLEIAQPAGSYVDHFTWGNTNVTLSARDELWRSSSLRLYGVGSLSLAVPSAEWGPRGSLFGLRALQVANAMSGWREQELYTSGTLPIGAGYGVLLEHARGGLDAELRLPVFLRFSRARLPSDADVRWVALTPVLRVAARYTPTRWFDLALAADTVFNRGAPVRPSRAGPSSQLVLTPSVEFRMREHWCLGVDFVLPVGGRLGGDAYAGGLSLRWQS